MTTHILAAAIALSDRDLLARISTLAGTERETTAELVAHLAALELRPSLYAAQGYGSLFDYCVRALRLSEDAACNRIRVTRVCRRFPVILDMLAAGSVSLRSVRVLGPHLTTENHMEVLARAADRRHGEIDALAAALAPKPDVVASVRKLPQPNANRPSSAAMQSPSPTLDASASASTTQGLVEPADSPMMSRSDWVAQPVPRVARPIIQPLAPNRYRVQFTIGQESHDKLRRLQALLRREVPSGDAGTLFERMLDVYLEKVERTKLGKTRGKRRTTATPPARTDAATPVARLPVKPAGAADHSYEIRIRPGADKPSRHIPNAVKRVVWFRDGGQCAFVSADGRRCNERTFLELHHIQPYALDGGATAANIALRCRRHNQYEADVVFGPRTLIRSGWS